MDTDKIYPSPSFSPPVVQAEDLSCVFRTPKASIAALTDISLSIPAGQMTAVVGSDGAGKTTFLRMLCGLIAPSSGSLQVLGYDASRNAQKIQNLISYMPQRFGLYEDLSVQENLNLYADLHGISQEVRKERFERLLEMTDLAAFTKRPAGKLSGGMKQKLALACTLVRTPRLLLLDEPSVGVDPLSRRDLWIIIEQMVREERISVIVSTAYMDEAERCSCVYVMFEGKLIAQGTPEELRRLTAGMCFEADVPSRLRARQFQAWLLDQPDYIMDAVPQGARVRFVVDEKFRHAGLPFKQLISPGQISLDEKNVHPSAPRLEDSFMFLLKKNEASSSILPPPALSSHGVSFLEEASETPAKEIVIEVRDLVRKFGDFVAVDKTNFCVAKGEVFGLLGPNGAGKTTTFRMLCGLLPASSGYLSVAGKNLRKAAAPARAKIGYVSQKFSLYGNLSVMENLLFFGGVYGLTAEELKKRIAAVLEQFDLLGHEDDLSGDLPAGFKQRLAMAAGLLHQPEILFLDEPTSGIDPLARRLFWRRITELAESGTTVIITTHFMEEAEYCDRMLIQDAGRVLSLGTPGEVRAQGEAETMEEAFIGIVEKARGIGKKESA